MVNKKWLSAASSALLIGTLLSACGSGGNDSNAASHAANTANTAISDADAKQTVTVSVFTEDRFLEESVSKFEQAHPNIDIQIQETVPTDTSGNQMRIQSGPSGDNGPAAGDIEKYVNTVGAALMSGKGSDLIATGYLPVDRYLDKGMFADWSELVGKDKSFNSADYYERVLKGMTGSAGWYAIPVGFSLDVLIGNQSALDSAGGVNDKTWNWEQFIALCDKISKQAAAKGGNAHVLSGLKPEDLLGYLAETVYSKLVTKNGNSSFDMDAFRGYLEQVKKLYDSGAMSAEDLGRMQQVFSKMNISEPMQLATLPSALGNGEGVVLNPPGTGEDEGLPFSSDLAFALNARSKVKPAAWEFVKFLLSEEIQASPSMRSFPVHQAAVKTKLEQFAEMQKSGKMKMMIKDKNGSAQSLTVTPEEIDSVLKLLPTVGKYEKKDTKVIAMIREEAASYFSGGKPAEAVAKSAASRIETYLNE